MPERDLPLYAHLPRLPAQVTTLEVNRQVERRVPVERRSLRQVAVPVERRIEIPVEQLRAVAVPRVVDSPVPVERWRPIELARPVEVTETRAVRLRVERPVVVENLVEHIIPRERLVIKDVHVRVEHVVEKPRYIENIVRKEVERLVEVPRPVDELVEVPSVAYTHCALRVTAARPRLTDRPVRLCKPRVLAQPVAVPQQVDVLRFRPVEHHLESVVPLFEVEEVRVALALEVPVRVSREVPSIARNPVAFDAKTTRETVTFVERVVEVPVRVDRVVEKRVEQIIEKEVVEEIDVPVHVPVRVRVVVPTVREVIVEELIDVQLIQETFEYTADCESEFPVHAETIKRLCSTLEAEIAQTSAQSGLLSARKRATEAETSVLRDFYQGDGGARQRELYSVRAELISRLRNAREEHALLSRKQQRTLVVREEFMEDNPEVNGLLAQLRTSLTENEKLVEAIRYKADQLTAIITNNTQTIAF